MAFSKLVMLKDKYADIFSKVLGFIGGESSDISEAILRFDSLSNIALISSVSSAVSLDNKKNFCRTIPNDNEQASVMISILNQLNWTCAIGLYANTAYGINGNIVLTNLMSKANYRYSSQVIDDLNATRYFVENSQTDIVLIFSDLKRVQNYFQYLNNVNSKSKKIYIMGDSWVNLLNLNKNTKLNFIILRFFILDTRSFKKQCKVFSWNACN